MKKISLKGKDIFIVDSHNQVLEAWNLAEKSNVFSLDYHTDTKRAFQTYAYWRAHSELKAGLYQDHDKRTDQLIEQKISGYLEKKISLNRINDNLKHDEHVDFAVRTQIVNRVFILARNRNEASSNPHVFLVHGNDDFHDQRIIEYSPPCLPACHKTTHDGACRIGQADSAIEDSTLDDAINQALICDRDFFKSYILDIDCDFFNTERSLNPEKSSTFLKLMRDSRLITIALEPVCVKICRQKGALLDSETILKRLISLINEG